MIDACAVRVTACSRVIFACIHSSGLTILSGHPFVRVLASITVECIFIQLNPRRSLGFPALSFPLPLLLTPLPLILPHGDNNVSDQHHVRRDSSRRARPRVVSREDCARSQEVDGDGGGEHEEREGEELDYYGAVVGLSQRRPAKGGISGGREERDDLLR